MKETPQPQKESTWQRLTGGIKRFASHAIGYLPRGAVLTSIVFAISAGLETAFPGFGFLGISKLGGEALAARFLAHLAVGSAVSGVLGATVGNDAPCPAGTKPACVPCNPFSLSETEKGLGKNIAQGIETHAVSAVSETVLPGSGLPVSLVKTALGNSTPQRG